MTQEQIIDYNKRCSEFLGYKNDTVNGRSVVRIPDKPWTEWSNRFQEYVEDNWYALYEPSFHPLRFHSDWNWIHELVEAIEKLEYESTKVLDEFRIESFQVVVRAWITPEHKLYNIIPCEPKTKKEAVVQAIDSFLKFYNKNLEI